MLRFALALLALSLAAAPAQAAGLVHPGKAAKTIERGVAVWRGAAPQAPAPDTIALAAAPASACKQTIVVISPAGFAPRRQARHGFWWGHPVRRPYGAATSGFFADRMAAGY